MRQDERRIRLGINATPLLSPKTGIGQYIFHLANALQESGKAAPYYFYSAGWSDELRRGSVKHISTVKRLVRKFVPKPYVVSRWLQQKAFTAGARNSAIELYHEPNYLAFEFDGPMVLTAHDVSWVRYPETHPRDRLDAIARYLPRSLERASGVLTDCQFVKKELIEVFGLPPEKVFPVLLGVSRDFYPRAEADCTEVLANHGIGHKKYVLCVGTLEPRKNIPSLIEAFSTLPLRVQQEYPLVLVGLRGWLTSTIEAKMAPLVAAGLIKPLGYVPDEDMPYLYSGSAAFVFPSFYEGFGLPVLEAMACGAPVVSSDRSSLPEVAGEGAVLVDPESVDAIKEALWRVLEDSVFAESLAQRALAQAAKFSWQKTAEETLFVYRRVLAAT